MPVPALWESAEEKSVVEVDEGESQINRESQIGLPTFEIYRSSKISDWFEFTFVPILKLFSPSGITVLA
jgi:hypothetical protein